MRKKFLLGFLTACTLAATATGASLITASANISTNSPTGTNGLMKGGTLNTEQFMYMNDTEPSAYTEKSGNSTYKFTNVAWRGATITPIKQIPAADVVDGAKFYVQFDVYKFSATWNSCWWVDPFEAHEWLGSNANLFRPANGSTFFYNSGTADAKYGEDAVANLNIPGFGFQSDYLVGNDYVTFWFEFDVATKSMTVYHGDAATGEMVKGGTITNAFAITTGLTGYFTNIYLDSADSEVELDNLKVYSVNGETETVYTAIDFQDNTKVVPAYDASKQDAVSINTGAFNTYDNLITVNAPAENTAIVTTNKLNVTDTLTTTFETSLAYNFETLAEGRKVGLAFGLESYRTKLNAPVEGASMLYFTKNGEGIGMGVENIAEDGTATAVGELVSLTQTYGEKITLSITGKSDTKIAVSVNGGEAVEFDGLKLNGHMALAQTGSAENTVKYSIYADSFTTTAYNFNENEKDDVITATFDGDYISTDKFSFQSTVAPDTYYIEQEGTSHDVEGLVADGGKVGFYGTSTNTRLMINGQYGDFVLQFDYISSPFTSRVMPGGIKNGGSPNRYSPLFLLFGATSQIPELAEAYAMGIIDGNATQYFWGAESLINVEGKLTGHASLAVLSGMAQVGDGEEYDAAIPCWNAFGEEPNFMGKPANEANSLYNKTTRMKLVSINNKVVLYGATVSENGEVGEYRQLMSCVVPNAYGYVGFGTDAPGWYEIDNVAFTPISSETAIAAGTNVTVTSDLVADVAVADMETDVEPTPLAKTTVTVANGKATWTAVEGAKEYKVTAYDVVNENVLLIDETVTALEYDLSAITEVGSYKVKVVAVPEDTKAHLNSMAASADFTVEKKSSESESESTGSESTKPEKKSGCGSVMTVAGIGAMVTLLGSAVLLKKKEN